MVHGLVSHNSEPNLQQIPREGLIKRLFGTRFGKRGCLYQADLSQIELRLLACACGDPRMVAAYVNGQDLHSLTASNIFRLPYEHFLEEYDIWLQKNGKNKEAKELKRKRKISKTANFLTGYGGGALGFQSSLATQGIYLPIEECETHLNNFFDTYPYLKVWISYYKRAIQEKGLAVSPTGRVRILDEVFSDDPQQSNKALRAGVNHAIQSWASDMMLGCLVAIEHLMREDNLESMLISTVHDSLVIDAVREEIPKVHEIVTGVLENIPEVLQVVFGEQFDTSTIICPLGGSYEVGPNYLDQKTIGDKPDWDQLLAV
jgi:DNA polymerase-1